MTKIKDKISGLLEQFYFEAKKDPAMLKAMQKNAALERIELQLSTLKELEGDAEVLQPPVSGIE